MSVQSTNIMISVNVYNVLQQILHSAPILKTILENSITLPEFLSHLRKWFTTEINKSALASKYYNHSFTSRQAFKSLTWKDYATIRLLDYLDHEGNHYEDQNLKGEMVVSQPFEQIWMAYKHGKSAANVDFFKDMLHLFIQFCQDVDFENVSEELINTWMKRHPSGLDPEIIEIRKQNKQRIILKFIEKIDKGEIVKSNFTFNETDTFNDKLEKMNEWWMQRSFHLQFAIDDPETLNEMLDFSLNEPTMEILREAHQKKIPFFINPYYLSLLNANLDPRFLGSDQTIRDYIFHNKELNDEFGRIVAWEKEDIVKEGKPNAAGWILPSPSLHNVHRRYPEVAILIPDTVGRACGGLCISCQRMYDFQSGRLNFDLEKLKPKEAWNQKLKRLMSYFENDSQLRDILITGGDALMSSDTSLKQILEEVYLMALRKKEANQNRPNGQKFAELIRVRLGTRLPAYIPQRITSDFIDLLKDFKQKASKIGIQQFVIQTHFESAMEVTPEVKHAIEQLLSAGWMVTNQIVFTVAASRRGHTAKLRSILNKLGMITYYTFTVKGYRENKYNFATNARAVQEQLEEKKFGIVPQSFTERIKMLPKDAENMVANIHALCADAGLPFLATDRNVLNMPGVGKSQTFRTIGITNDGRRILEFEHDTTRNHSPVIHKMDKVIIIESKTMSEYLNQLEDMGEDRKEYESVFGYSLGSTEPVMPIYSYPKYDFKITDELTNFEMPA